MPGNGLQDRAVKPGRTYDTLSSETAIALGSCTEQDCERIRGAFAYGGFRPSIASGLIYRPRPMLGDERPP